MCRKSINLRIVFFGIVKTSATSQWALDSENDDLTAVTKNRRMLANKKCTLQARVTHLYN